MSSVPVFIQNEILQVSPSTKSLSVELSIIKLLPSVVNPSLNIPSGYVVVSAVVIVKLLISSTKSLSNFQCAIKPLSLPSKYNFSTSAADNALSYMRKSSK